MTLKAYKISCPDIDSHAMCVVFAKTRYAARHHDSRDCDCEFIEICIHRAPDFDELAPGPVTVEQYLARSWAFPCHNCESQLYDDNLPIIIGDAVYCNKKCVLETRERNREYDTKDAHESIKRLGRELDEWLSKQAIGEPALAAGALNQKELK